jgi:lysophospholipase L1-like esterase
VATGKTKRLLKRLLAATIATFVALALAEVLLRALDPLGAEDVAQREALAGKVIRNGKAGLELVPGGRASYLGHEIVIGSHGMRNRETPIAKPPDTYRILVLGDSIAFGFGVAEKDAFPRVVERQLRDHTLRAGHPRVEVINAGVPGWNLVNSYLFLKERGLAFQPDLVLLTLVNNDVPAVDKLAEATERRVLLPSWVRTAYLGRFAQTGLDRWRRVRPEYWIGHDLTASGVKHVADVLELFKTLCGDIQFALIDTIGEKGKPAAPGIAEATRTRGIPHIEAFIDHTDYMARYAVAPSDPHPNAAGHLELAREVVAWLRTKLVK